MMRRAYTCLEWGLLLATAPFLLFPTFRVAGTLVALIVLALFWLVSAFIRKPWTPTPFNAALLLFALAAGVGILVTAWPELTLPKATGLVLGLGLFRAMAALRGCVGWRWGMLVLAGLGLGIAMVGTLSASFYVKIPVVAPLIARLPARLLTLPESPEGGVSPNQLAGILAFYLPLALGFLWWALSQLLAGLGKAGSLGKSGMPGSGALNLAWLFLAVFSVLLTGGLLVITQSRSGWIGGVAGALALLGPVVWCSGRRWLRVSVLALLALVLLGGGLFVARVPTEMLDRAWADDVVTETEFTGKVSFSGRVEIWSRALYAIQDFPFTGCGLGTLRKVVPLLYPPFSISPTADIAHAHNIFLQTATDVGLPGLIAYLALLGVAFAVAWHSKPQKGLPLLGALVALHIYGLTDAVALGSKPGIVFWASLGVLAMLAPTVEAAAGAGGMEDKS
ncbi:MAG: O-antigen ligase family protein [Anaerolineae bacterium]|nr:O-antigen ligase family protein [Anaerolineae bacterium]